MESPVEDEVVVVLRWGGATTLAGAAKKEVLRVMEMGVARKASVPVLIHSSNKRQQHMAIAGAATKILLIDTVMVD